MKEEENIPRSACIAIGNVLVQSLCRHALRLSIANENDAQNASVFALCVFNRHKPKDSTRNSVIASCMLLKMIYIQPILFHRAIQVHFTTHSKKTTEVLDTFNK